MEASLWQCEGLTEDFYPTLHVCKGVRCLKFKMSWPFLTFPDSVIYSVSPSCVSKWGLSVGTPSNVNWICRSLKKRLFFSMKFHLLTFFRCVIPCACTIQIQNAIVIYISFKLPPKSIRCYLQIFLPTPVRYSGEFIKLILYLVLYFFWFFGLNITVSVILVLFEYYCRYSQLNTHF